MTLGCLMVDVAGRALLPGDRELLEHPLVGGVILFSRNYESPAQLAALTAEIRALRTPRLLLAADHEGGRVQRFRPEFTLLPPMRRLGREYDMDAARGRELARDAGWLLAAELRAFGLDLAFAPVVDLEYGVSEVIGDRALHADADAVALPVDRRRYQDLTADLTPYRRLIANGLPSVMMAHVVYPEVDALPASLSRRWVGDILRGELDFQGAVFTDDLSMAGAAAFGGVLERARLALEAGCDMLPVCNSRPSVQLLLERLEARPGPASALRLARLHGREPATELATPELLRASARWRHAHATLARARDERPELWLDGEAS